MRCVHTLLSKNAFPNVHFLLALRLTVLLFSRTLGALKGHTRNTEKGGRHFDRAAAAKGKKAPSQ